MTCPSPPSGQRKKQLCQFIRGGREGDEEASMWLKELSLSVGSPLKRLPINLERSLCLSLWAFGPPLPSPAPSPRKKRFLIGERDIYALQNPRDCLRDSHLETGTVELLHCGCIAVDGRGDSEVDKTDTDRHTYTGTQTL